MLTNKDLNEICPWCGNKLRKQRCPICRGLLKTLVRLERAKQGEIAAIIAQEKLRNEIKTVYINAKEKKKENEQRSSDSSPIEVQQE